MQLLKTLNLNSQSVHINFYGMKFDEIYRYQKITFERNGQSTEFLPDDPAAIVNSGYFGDIISPNEEFIVLPEGPFEGFCVFTTNDLIENVSSHACHKKVSLKLEGANQEASPLLYHNFIRWVDDTSFEFQAGLSEIDYRCVYDIRTDDIGINPPTKGLRIDVEK